jgi:hypothetical protein
MATDPRTIAARLGIGETFVRRLQTRGYLQELPLGDAEIRRRLYHAHRAFVLGAGSADPEPHAIADEPGHDPVAESAAGGRLQLVGLQLVERGPDRAREPG